MSSVNKHGLGRGLGALLGDDDLNLDLEFLDDEKQKFEYTDEIAGILIILMCIIGIGAYGPAGKFVMSFAVFSVGTLWSL